MTKVTGKQDGLKLLAEETFRHYTQTFETLSEDQKAWVNALCDTSYNLTKRVEEYTFTSTAAADKICVGLNYGWLKKDFSRGDIVAFCINENVPMRPDWKDRLEAVSKPTVVNDGPRQTWVKQLKVKGAKWEDVSIAVAPGGTIVKFPECKPIIETWAGDPGFLTRREGLLLNDFQLTATLEAKKNTVSILRAALIKASGISEDPFTCEDGLYTRLFSMGDQGGATGGESEERFNDGYQIRTARRR